MPLFGVIGGSGFTSLESLEISHREFVRTPYGPPSAPVTFGKFGGHDVVFLPRHGAGHTIPPHMVNYRANMWALKDLGVKYLIGMAAVGGITKKMQPTKIVIPDQIIDYTTGRASTFFSKNLQEVVHIDFTEPYCETLRQKLLQTAADISLDAVDGGTYAAMQGPRLETAAEINRLEQDGCDIVGMTGMPEAALAREAEICYAHCAIVVNWAAGRNDGPITMDDIQKNLDVGMKYARSLLQNLKL